VSRPAGEKPEAVSLDEKPLATFRDIGAVFKDGLPLRPWAKELHTFPRKIIQTPDEVLLLYETH